VNETNKTTRKSDLGCLGCAFKSGKYLRGSLHVTQ